eukprot:549167-Prymnesium_polylepis.1
MLDLTPSLQYNVIAALSPHNAPLTAASSGCKVLELLDAAARRMELSDDQTEDDERAQNAVIVLSMLVLDAAHELYATPGSERLALARDEARIAGGGRDGSTWFALERLRSAAVCAAPTVHGVLVDCRTLQSVLGCVMRLGNAYLQPHMAAAEMLYTPDGLRELEAA